MELTYSWAPSSPVPLGAFIAGALFPGAFFDRHEGTELRTMAASLPTTTVIEVRGCSTGDRPAGSDRDRYRRRNEVERTSNRQPGRTRSQAPPADQRRCRSQTVFQGP
ncbi:hypothetical protein SRO_0148 [Streptomyces rochei]|nr:hypothetical protein SRO_0148 [Streptomyces rochei]